MQLVDWPYEEIHQEKTPSPLMATGQKYRSFPDIKVL